MNINSYEYIFATELLTSVMELYSVKWKPNKALVFKNQSPFTPIVKKAVGYIWNEYKEFLKDLFDTVLKLGTINMANYKAAVEFASHLMTEAEYDEIELLRVCVIASGFASLFYIGGLKDVPSQCIKLIFDTITSFKIKNQFTHESWRDIEILGEAYSANEDFANPTSACSSQLSENESSTNFRHMKDISPNVENKFATKIFAHEIKHSIKNSGNTSYKKSMKNEKKKNAELIKPENTKKQFKKAKKSNKKIIELEVVNKISEERVNQTFLKTESDQEEFVSSKFTTLEKDEGTTAEQKNIPLFIKRAKSQDKKTTKKHKLNNAAETLKKHEKNSVKQSEASNCLKKEMSEISNAFATVNIIKDDEIISETNNSAGNINMIAYKPNKVEIIKQETDEDSKSWISEEVKNIIKGANKIEYTTIFCKQCKHKLIKSKRKKLKEE